jgi:phosphoesterase RecJ-like protein
MAKALFAAIATDTGWFRFSSVGEATFDAAARLVAAGARPDALFGQLYEQNSLARLRLQGRILQNVTSELDGRLLYSAITQADLRDTGAEPTDTEDVVNRLLSVAEVDVAILFFEFGPQETKVSLRSRAALDVRKIAEEFFGGGHRAAAGVRFQGSLVEAVPAILGSIRAVMQRGGAQ